MWFHDFPYERKLYFRLVAESKSSLSELMWIDGIEFDERRSRGVVDFTQFGRGDAAFDLWTDQTVTGFGNN